MDDYNTIEGMENGYSIVIDERKGLLGNNTSNINELYSYNSSHARNQLKSIDKQSGNFSSCTHAQDPSPDDPTEKLKLKTQKKKNSTGHDKTKAPIYLIILYSIINTIMCVPCLYGYAAVIFNNQAFQPHINALSKLVLLSSVIHQISFTCLSTLPFAIGQVQDAGLIFLSQMANIMTHRLQSQDVTDEELLSTVIIILGIATSSLGVVLVLMGKFRMADLVSYLPLPVVGGYLAYIGYFCLEAGVSLCISKSITQLRDWNYLMNLNIFLLALPGLVGGMLIMLASRSCHSETALPLSMMILPLLFYLIVFLVPHFSLEVARDNGWMGEKSPRMPVREVFAMIHPNNVHWDVLMDCIPTWAGMVIVVAFSSCLDVAAISMDLGEPLDTNAELITVGASNGELIFT